VEPAVVSVTVSSRPLRKRFPRPGQMVRMEDRRGLFRVSRVDEEQRVADLLQRVSVRGADVMEKDVPFRLIHAVPKGASRVIRQFLQS
jgi:hypothetical protein